MSGISSLGYLGLGVKDLAAWETFATQILGLQSAGVREDGTLQLRMDEYAYRFSLHRDDADDLAYMGWEVADAAAYAKSPSGCAARASRWRAGLPIWLRRAELPSWYGSPIRMASRAKRSTDR